MTETTWHASWASQRGSAHGTDIPNQDAVHVESVETPTGPVWVVAVSDGHGGPRYVRSNQGSQIAVAVAAECVTATLAGDHHHVGAAPVDRLRNVAPLLVQRWRERVTTHLFENPLSDAEADTVGPASTRDPMLAYGATLLVVTVGNDGIGIAQIGDGDVLLHTNGYAMRPVPDDDRHVAGETTSLCLSSAVKDFRYAGLTDAADTDLVLVATDGYGNSFAAPDWWRTLINDFAPYVETKQGFDEVNSGLESWLAESAQVGGDDVTAVILMRQPVDPTGKVSQPDTTVEPGPAPVRKTLILPDEPDEPQERDTPPAEDPPEEVEAPPFLQDEDSTTPPEPISPSSSAAGEAPGETDEGEEEPDSGDVQETRNEPDEGPDEVEAGQSRRRTRAVLVLLLVVLVAAAAAGLMLIRM